jgi:hypothetical protein
MCYLRLWELLLNVLSVRLSVKLNWVGALETWSASQLHSIHNLWSDEDLEICVVSSSVPVVCDVTSIHDFTIDVFKIVVGYFFVPS